MVQKGGGQTLCSSMAVTLYECRMCSWIGKRVVVGCCRSGAEIRLPRGYRGWILDRAKLKYPLTATVQA